MERLNNTIQRKGWLETMDQEEILNNYSKLGISIESVPVYNNPIEFATHFKKCSITKYLDNISYSDSTDI